MNKNKKGFTLSEVLLVITILGFVITLCMKTVRNVQSSYTLLTYSAYNTVRDLVSAARSDDSILVECTASDGSIKKVFKYDNESYSSLIECQNRSRSTSVPSGEDYTSSTEFCEKLVEYANTKSTYHRDSSGRKEYADKYCNSSDIIYAPDFDTTSTVIEPKFPAIDFEKPNFTLTNGMRVYISKHAYTFDNSNCNTNALVRSGNSGNCKRVSKDFGYRLIGVDLNGEKRQKAQKLPSDRAITQLVTFIVLDDGLVLPLAQAADNAYIRDGETVKYMNAYVKYFYNNSTTGDNPNNTVVDECKVATSTNGCGYQCCERARKYTTHASDSTHILAPSGTSLTQKEKDSFSNKSVFSFREAYCKVTNHSDLTVSSESFNDFYCSNYVTPAEYNRKNYLDKEARNPDSDINDNINRYDKLPQCKDDYNGATKRSKCKVEVVKPAFRYDL